jgi:hypothetical protein
VIGLDLVSVFLQLLEKFFPTTFVGEAIVSPSYVLGAFVKDKVGVVVWIHIQVLCSVPLVFMSGFVPVPCCVYFHGSVV